MFNKVLWQKEDRRKFTEKKGFSRTANYAVGGIRETILKRDGYRCVKCSMTDGSHKETFNRPITIDHKDKNKKNNDPKNLQTLCLRCHGRKDLLPRLRVKRFLPYFNEAKIMRNNGKSYQEIADYFNVSIATVWKYLTNKGGKYVTRNS